MPSTVEDTASCALCRRHLLVGEPARLYQDPGSKRFAKVCPLCYERADRRGWRADGRPIVAVHANPPADQALRERESLIDRLRGQLQSVEFDLDQVRNALAKAEQQSGELRNDQARAQGASRRGAKARARAEVGAGGQAPGRRARRPGRGRSQGRDRPPPRRGGPARRAGGRGDPRRAGAAALEQELQAERERYNELADARRRESDPRHVRLHALEAFNRSQHADRVVAISRSLGDPIVNVVVGGIELPGRC